LAPACRQPALFYSAPATTIAHVEDLVSHYREHGLTLAAYLQAACRQPAFFCLTPATMTRHINSVINMQAQGLLTFPGETVAPDQHLKPCLHSW
jgi:hypothetical protein